jgi:hypothetical protein
MPWVRFTDNFDWRPKPQVTIAYKAGMHLLVTTPCAEQAVAAGKAVKRVKTKARSDERVRASQPVHGRSSDAAKPTGDISAPLSTGPDVL